MRARRTLPALVIGAIALVTLPPPAFSMQPNHVAFVSRSMHTEPPIVVTESRTADDEAITSKVVYSLQSDTSLAGRIGVQTTDGVVELSGIVTSPGQRLYAERDAMGVDGVRNVHNLLATRIGGGRY